MTMIDIDHQAKGGEDPDDGINETYDICHNKKCDIKQKFHIDMEAWQCKTVHQVSAP